MGMKQMFADGKRYVRTKISGARSKAPRPVVSQTSQSVNPVNLTNPVNPVSSVDLLDPHTFVEQTEGLADRAKGAQMEFWAVAGPFIIWLITGYADGYVFSNFKGLSLTDPLALIGYAIGFTVAALTLNIIIKSAQYFEGKRYKMCAIMVMVAIVLAVASVVAQYVLLEIQTNSGNLVAYDNAIEKVPLFSVMIGVGGLRGHDWLFLFRSGLLLIGEFVSIYVMPKKQEDFQRTIQKRRDRQRMYRDLLHDEQIEKIEQVIMQNARANLQGLLQLNTVVTPVTSVTPLSSATQPTQRQIAPPLNSVAPVNSNSNNRPYVNPVNSVAPVAPVATPVATPVAAPTPLNTVQPVNTPAKPIAPPVAPVNASVSVSSAPSVSSVPLVKPVVKSPVFVAQPPDKDALDLMSAKDTTLKDLKDLKDLPEPSKPLDDFAPLPDLSGILLNITSANANTGADVSHTVNSSNNFISRNFIVPVEETPVKKIEKIVQPEKPVEEKFFLVSRSGLDPKQELEEKFNQEQDREARLALARQYAVLYGVYPPLCSKEERAVCRKK